MDDFFDPNTWATEKPVCRIYGDTHAEIACLVDQKDYVHFSQWLWKTKQSKRSSKLYVKRCPHGLKDIYLHIEIAKRFLGPAPTKRRCIVDHENGDSLDNRRKNLRWVTRKQNDRNRKPANR